MCRPRISAVEGRAAVEGDGELGRRYAGYSVEDRLAFELMSVNLNRPRFVAELIQAARKRGWRA